MAKFHVTPSHCNRGKQWAKPQRFFFCFTSSVAMIGLLFQCHSHTPMIRHQLSPFWTNLDHRWTSSTSPKRCQCKVVFAQNLAILEQSSLPHVSYPKHQCVSWCVIMMQNPWLFFPQFYAFLTNCFSQSAHKFKGEFLIDRMTLWQEFMMHHAFKIE